MKENERAILQSEMWRLRTNLGDSGKDPDRSSLLNPLIDHRTKETRSLMTLNDSPSSKVENLESALVKSEGASIRDERKKFKNIEGSDKKDKEFIEGLIDSAGRLIIRTINDLSSELVSVNRKLNRERDRNESRSVEIDRLRAMIRVSSGDGNEYRKRISELNDFIQRLDRETWLLKSTHESVNFYENCKVNEGGINCLKSLMSELRTKLKNDREALFTGGNQWCSMYVKKIRELEVFAESLLLQLEITGSNLKFETCSIKFSSPSEYQREISETEQLVKRVAYELKSLTTLPIKIGSRVGGESCVKYCRRIEILEKLITSSRTIIDKLIVESKEVDQFEGTKINRNDSQCRENIETLEILAKKLISGIKQLEMVVAAGDGSYLLEKIRQLEASVKRLKNEIVAREEEKNSLTLELTGAKIAYGEKSEELEKFQKKFEKIAHRMKKRGESLDYEERMASLLRELEQSKLDADVLRDEVNRLKPEVTNIRAERTNLVDEIEKIRRIVEEKNDEIVKITRDKKSKERALTKETNETRAKLASAEKEIKCLKKEILDLKDDMEIKDNKATTELKNLKLLFKTTKENLDSKNNKFADLESNFNELTIEKTKIGRELSCMMKQNEALVVCLNSEKASCSKTLKDFKKLTSDFRTMNDNLTTLEAERKMLQKNLDDSEREKKHLRTENEEYLRKNALMENESSAVKSTLEKLRQELKETKDKNREMTEQLKRINGENKDREIRLDSLMQENDKLNDALDRARSDKLNIAGTLNEVKYNCELTKNLLDMKVNETRNMEEKLKITLEDLEALRSSENLAKLEIEKLLETSAKLKLTIDIASSDNKRLESRLKEAENDFQALENKLSILNAEKNALTSDSSMLNRRVDELTEEVTMLRFATEKNARERSELVDEHRNTVAALREKLDELENERASLANEVTRIRDENSSLKRDYEEIVCENEKIRSRGKKSEINRLRGENEALKFELSKLRIFISEADREVAKNEMGKICSELVQIRAENSTLKKLRNRRIIDEKSPRDSRKLEEQLSAWKTENDSLKKSLESARNKIAINDERAKEFETETNMLKGSIEGLKERYRITRRELDDARLQNQMLNNEMSELKKYLETTKLEDFALKQEVKNLRRDLESLNDEYSRMRKKFVETEIELAALKDELAKSRAENVSLGAQFDAKNADSRHLETEKTSLRNELEETRRSRMSAIEETNELRSECEKLVTLRVTLENKLIDAQKEIGKYVVATAKLNDFENKLKAVLKSYLITKKLLRSANEEIDHLRHIANPCFRRSNYNEKIEAS